MLLYFNLLTERCSDARNNAQPYRLKCAKTVILSQLVFKLNRKYDDATRGERETFHSDIGIVKLSNYFMFPEELKQ